KGSALWILDMTSGRKTRKRVNDYKKRSSPAITKLRIKKASLHSSRIGGKAPNGACSSRRTGRKTKRQASSTLSRNFSKWNIHLSGKKTSYRKLSTVRNRVIKTRNPF